MTYLWNTIIGRHFRQKRAPLLGAFPALGAFSALALISSCHAATLHHKAKPKVAVKKAGAKKAGAKKAVSKKAAYKKAVPKKAAAKKVAPRTAKVVSRTEYQIVPRDTAPRSVADLPVDRFDEYLTGALPPYPWTPTGNSAQNGDLLLQTEGETPFLGDFNKVTGKGLVMNDPSPTTGAGDGIKFPFNSPPPGPLYLGFDFKLTGDISAGHGEDLLAEMVDGEGRGLRLHLGEASSITIDAGGKSAALMGIKADNWYRLNIDVDAAGNAKITLFDSQNKRKANDLGTFSLGSNLSYNQLRFTNGGGNDRTGGWMVDDICMAGAADAPRAAWLPFTQLPAATMQATRKKVYAYYFPIYTIPYGSKDPGLSFYTSTIFNPSSLTGRSWEQTRVDSGTEFFFHPLPRTKMDASLSPHESLLKAMEEEVRLGKQMGLDGFFTDFSANGKVEDTFNQVSFTLMDAAAIVDPNFKIIPAIYAGDPPKEMPDGPAKDQAFGAAFANSEVVKKALSHPQALRLPDGRTMLSSWSPERFSAADWQQAMDALKAKGMPAAFVPQFGGGNDKMLASFAPFSFGMANFGPRTPREFHWAPQVRNMTKLTVAPTVFQDVRTRGQSYQESYNSDTFRKTWMSAINDNSDWVFINTWSDYTEQAQAPSTSIGYSLFDLNTYYTQWFKTGTQPPITKDVLYYFYRRQHTEAPQNHGTPWHLVGGGVPDYAPQNQIELLGFLKQPGQLRIQVGSQVYKQDAPGGITSFKVPLPKGQTFTPVFSLVRGNNVELLGKGRYTVVDQVEYPNFLYHGGIITNGK